MAEHKEQSEFNSKIIAFFRKKSSEGLISLTIPDVVKGLKVDRRRIETSLAVMSSQENPNAKLIEIEKSRVKYYILKEVFEFCQKWAREKYE
ncbi:MAG: hypothetical protein ABSA75_11465 [Candidatus Bathyarchaeia archaeon]